MISIKVITWYDTVTAESAENGDYESAGNDTRSIDFDEDDSLGAVYTFVDKYKNGSWDTHGFDYVNNVLYDTDGEQDYQTGSKDFQRLTIQVDSPDPIKYPKQKKLEQKLNEMIHQQLIRHIK